jgi:hypothetical protein
MQASKLVLNLINGRKEMFIYNIVDEILMSGCYEVEDGLFFWTQEGIIDDQEGWYDEDPWKNFDFTTANFWLTHKVMTEPEPYETIKEFFNEHLEKY